ncbi:MAG TPA: M81 family metallopeptidase [Rhizomicrobium sp.]|nr:M81 family metallopeptidase [Rhizomicrobium sp.]
MRILVAGFQHETNTFAPSKTGYVDFVRGGAFPAMVHGADVLALRDVNIPMGGFIRAMEGPGVELVPVLWAGATPAAQVEREAFEQIAGEIIATAQELTLDAVYLDLHGAMVCEHEDDGEGLLLERLRQAVGPRVPIVASLDLHANVTRRMLTLADALVAYRTYPHEDMAETGERAAGLLKLLLQLGERMPCAARRLPFLIPINGMCTFVDPARAIYRSLQSAEQTGGLHLSFAPGFPAADFPECGGVVWGYGAAVEDQVDALTRQIIEREAAWMVPLLEPMEAVREAQRLAASASGPVVIADTQDNPGGGGDSNTTGMLRALLDCCADGAALGLMVDAAAAATAHQAGVGNDITIALGGTSGVVGDAPFHATFRIEQLSQGRCRFEGPMMRGKLTDVGPSARLSIGGVQVVVSTWKDQMLDRNLYRMAGIEPERMKILVNKSSVHFRADFQPIAAAILVAKAPGPLRADPADFPWRRLSPGLRLRPLGPAFALPNDGI